MRMTIPGGWSPTQDAALADASRWMSDASSSQVYRLFGPAGVGKTTLVRELVGSSSRRWLYAAFTGKAALVMRQKGCDGAQTIHSMIYRPDGSVKSEDGKSRPTFRLWDESPLRWGPGLVLDECSMVDDEIGKDLLSFGKKILVCGDPDQLPPVAGGGFFTSGAPDFLLTEVHRQARESGILDLATFVREGGDLARRVGWSVDDCSVLRRDRCEARGLWERMIDADQVIVGTNRTRRSFNARYRQMAGAASPYPISGDKVICLRNNRSSGLFNGGLWRVRDAELSADRETVEMSLESEDSSSAQTVRSWTHHFVGRSAEVDDMCGVRMMHDEFDFGYFITCHKAQGSQWDDVVVFDESRVFDPDTARRWLYTSMTRAARRLLVVT